MLYYSCGYLFFALSTAYNPYAHYGKSFLESLFRRCERFSVCPQVLKVLWYNGLA